MLIDSAQIALHAGVVELQVAAARIVTLDGSPLGGDQQGRRDPFRRLGKTNRETALNRYASIIGLPEKSLAEYKRLHAAETAL